jgi:hypothetical protein
MGPARTPSFSGKRQLRGQPARRRTQADAAEAFYQAQTGVPFSDEWDFRHQRFVDPPEEEEGGGQGQGQGQEGAAPAQPQEHGAIAPGGVMDTKRGQSGSVVNPNAGQPAVEKAAKAALTRMGPATGGDGDGAGNGGGGTSPDGGATNPTQRAVPSPNAPPAAAAPPPAEQPPVDDYVGGTGEITVVRFCSREVVCQVCMACLLRGVCAGGGGGGCNLGLELTLT